MKEPIAKVEVFTPVAAPKTYTKKLSIKEGVSKAAYIALDFETYYDKLYTLLRMPTQAYVTDQRFQIIGFSFIATDEDFNVIDSGWCEEPMMLQLLEAVKDNHNVTWIAHNMAFDGSILYHHYRYVAPFYACTASLARFTGLREVAGGKASLEAILTHLNEQGIIDYVKGDTVKNMAGLHRADLGTKAWHEYGDYCDTDTKGTLMLYKLLRDKVSDLEFEWEDIILRCAVNPCLRLDALKLRTFIDGEIASHGERLNTLCIQLGLETGPSGQEKLAKLLRSDQKMKEVLEFLDVDVVLKTTTKGNLKPAFAKTDEFMGELLDSPNPLVQSVAVCRLGEKGGGDVKRASRLLTCPHFGFGAPYFISGARTHRLSGSDGINMQNLSSGRVAGKTTVLREAILPPRGYKLVAADSSQIEARMLAYAAGDEELLEIFKNGGDPYSFQASAIYGIPADVIAQGNKDHSAVHKNMRAIGKALVLGCGYGMSGAKFYAFTKAMGVIITESEALEYVAAYRRSRNRITALWRSAESAFREALSNKSTVAFSDIPGVGYVYLEHFGVPTIALNMPDGSCIWYTRPGIDDSGGLTWSSGAATYRIYGGLLVENFIQAISFCLLKYQASLITYPIVMNTHDEHVVVAKEDDANAEGSLLTAMTTVPQWLRGFPCGATVASGENYGQCK